MVSRSAVHTTSGLQHTDLLTSQGLAEVGRLLLRRPLRQLQDLANGLHMVCLWMFAVNPASFSTNAINHWWQSDLAQLSLSLCLV